MKNRILTIFIIGFLSAATFAQDLTLPVLSGFKRLTNYPVFVPENLWDFINGAADTYLAYGFIDLHVAEYKKGKDVIKLEIYRHSNEIMAFGIYSTERSPSFRFVNMGAQGYIADGAINFFKGNYYVKIKTYSKKQKVIQAAETLARKTELLLEGTTAMPSILSEFPDEGRKINEETYINESVLGHSFLNKAFKALYQSGTDNFSVFIIKGASPEETRKTAETFIASTGIDAMSSGEGKFVLSDGYNGTVFLAWKEDLIVILSGLARDQADIAERYTSAILK